MLSYERVISSIGGNNALSYMHHLNERVTTVSQALIVLSQIKKQFEKVNYNDD